jgi:predicted transcriptional regulator
MIKQNLINETGDVTNNLAERFEVAFNQIHHILRKLNPNVVNDAFMKLLYDSSRKHRIIQKFYQDLRQFAKLRNALVHEKMKIQTYIAIPSEETVLQIETIARLLKEPPSVMKIATPLVISMKMTDSIEEVIKKMHQCSYNQFPVYDKGVFQFLLTECGLTSWLASSIINQNISLAEKTVSNIQPFENIHNVVFVDRTIDIFELEDIYEESFQKGKKLEAIIVTEHGLPTEKPFGIVTPWDLIEIDLLGIGN